MFIDGIDVAGHAVIIALGVTADGTKVPLGVWCGSTENHVVAAALMQDLLARGLRVAGPLLFVIDGGKGIRITGRCGARQTGMRCYPRAKVRARIGNLGCPAVPSSTRRRPILTRTGPIIRISQC